MDRLFELDASRDLLLRCAMAGEREACGSAHADNAAPCVYGGFVLIRHPDPPDVVPLPVIDNGTVVGLIQHSDVMKWVSLHEEE